MATKSPRTNGNYRERAGEYLSRARQEATTPRLIAAGAVAAGAAAYALLRDASRRDLIRESARDYLDRGMAWWHSGSTAEAPAASEIAVS